MVFLSTTSVDDMLGKLSMNQRSSTNDITQLPVRNRCTGKTFIVYISKYKWFQKAHVLDFLSVWLAMSWRFLSRSVRFFNCNEKGGKGSTKPQTLPKNKIAKMLTMSMDTQIIWQFCLKVIALNHELYYLHFAQCACNLLHEAWKCWTQKGFCYILTWLPGGPWTFIFAFFSNNFFCSDHLYA